MLSEVQAVLPPGGRTCSEDEVQMHFRLTADKDGLYTLLAGESPVVRDVDPRVALGVLDARLRGAIASRTPDWVFIHAGVVAIGDRAAAIPGRSFSGKTTLVRSLIRAGASYLSDEYAVLDADGRVHPYPKPLSIRNGSSRTDTNEVAASELGALVGERPAAVALVVKTEYEPGASWKPTNGSVAAAALARDQPQRVMSAVSRAASHARLLDGKCGEADEVAAGLLAELAA